MRQEDLTLKKSVVGTLPTTVQARTMAGGLLMVAADSPTAETPLSLAEVREIVRKLRGG